jgi:hypothetical protein
MGAPIYMPADPAIGAPEVPALPVRSEAFARLPAVLLREVHPGPAWPAVAAYSELALITAAWLALFTASARAVGPVPELASELPAPGATYRPQPPPVPVGPSLRAGGGRFDAARRA